MAGGTAERQAGVEGLGEMGGDATKGRGIIQSGGSILQGGSTGKYLIWIGVLDHVNNNGENGGRYTHRVSETNNREARMAEGGQDMVYTRGRGSEGIGGNSVSNNLHLKKTGDGGIVGGILENIRSLHKGNGL